MRAVSAVRSNKKADRNSAAEVRDVDHEIGFGFVTAAAVAVDEEEIMVREITGTVGPEIANWSTRLVTWRARQHENLRTRKPLYG